MQPKKRSSNVELLRIIAMLMIIVHHFSVHGPWPTEVGTGAALAVNLLSFGGKIACDAPLSLRFVPGVLYQRFRRSKPCMISQIQQTHELPGVSLCGDSICGCLQADASTRF